MSGDSPLLAMAWTHLTDQFLLWVHPTCAFITGPSIDFNGFWVILHFPVHIKGGFAGHLAVVGTAPPKTRSWLKYPITWKRFSAIGSGLLYCPPFLLSE